MRFSHVAIAAALVPALTIAPPVRAEMTGVIDLADYFPAAEMSRTHILKGSGGPLSNWDLRPMLNDGNYNVFYGKSTSAAAPNAADVYIVGDTYVALIMNVLGDESVIHQTLPLPHLPRRLNLADLPIFTSTQFHGVHRTLDGVMTILPLTVTPVHISRDGDLIKLHWGTEETHEILWIGDVPIEGTFLTAPGLRRYKARYEIHDFTTDFEWSPRAEPIR